MRELRGRALPLSDAGYGPELLDERVSALDDLGVPKAMTRTWNRGLASLGAA